MSNRVPKAVSDSGSHLHNGVVGPPIGASCLVGGAYGAGGEGDRCLFVCFHPNEAFNVACTNKQTNKQTSGVYNV